MVMTNAERQAAFRVRRKANFTRLKNFYAEARKRWTSLLQAEADRLRRDPQHARKSKIALATLIKKNLNLPEAAATIAKRIR